MQRRRVTTTTVVVLATIWLLVSVGVVGTATHRPSHPTLDQYSPLPPHRRPVYQRVEDRADWKDQDRGEDQSLGVSIGPGGQVLGNEFPRRAFEVKHPGKDSILQQAHDVSSANDFPSLTNEKQSARRHLSRSGNQRHGHRVAKLHESFSREIPASGFEDPFVADETFQDQGPGSVEIYKLDLFKERSLLSPVSTTGLPVRSKSKPPKKTSRVNWKAKSGTTEYKTVSPKMGQQHRQSNFFEEQRTEVPPTDSFGIGGVPELQVGCEGLEASSHKLKRSIDASSKEKPPPLSDPWADVTPISLDLDYELSSEDAYEEMDELLKLKKLETTTKRAKQNRGDMEATSHRDDFVLEKGYPEKLPVRGDLGNATDTKRVPSPLGSPDNRRGEARGNLINSRRGNWNDEPGKGDGPRAGNQARRLLWHQESSRGQRPEDGTRRRRGIWGFSEDEGVAVSEELQTEHERRRQEYERRQRKAAVDQAPVNRSGVEINKIRDDYDRALMHREHQEAERLRRVQLENSRRQFERRREEEERLEEERRRQEEHRNRLSGRSNDLQREERTKDAARMEEERRRDEAEAYRRGSHVRSPETRPGEGAGRLTAKDEEELRRAELRLEAQREMQRRKHAQEHQRRMMEEDRRRREQYRYQEASASKREEEEKRGRLHEGTRARPRENTIPEDRRRQWDLRNRQAEEEERRKHSRERSKTEVDRRSQDRDRDRLLREYRNGSASTDRVDRPRVGDDRMRYHTENRPYPVHPVHPDHPVHPVPSATLRPEHDGDRRRMEAERRRAEEERRYQEYVRRNQPAGWNNTWTEDRRAMEEARRNARPRRPGADAARRDHGPSAPVYVDPRSYGAPARTSWELEQQRRMEQERRLEHERRLEEERRVKEKQRQEQEELRKEMQRREEEERKAQSRRYEEDRRRHEAARLAEERRRKQLTEEEARRTHSGRRWPVENRRPTHGDRGRVSEDRWRQDASLVPANLHLDDARAAASRERQRQEQERRRIEAERRREEEDRTKEARLKEERDRSMKEQWRRREEARLNALPVSARIILRPGGTRPSSRPSSQGAHPRAGFANEIDFPGITPNRQGVQVPRFPAPSTASPLTKGPGPCVWAVVQCCSANRNRLVTCFESLGCPGINWDPNPCRSSIAQAALEEVMKFYATAEQENYRYQK